MTFERSIDISAPPDIVWSVISGVERWHEWTPSITSVRLLGGPLEIGRRALIKQPRFPPALWTVTAIEPGRSFTWRTTAPGMRVRGDHRVEPAPGGARAILTLQYAGPVGRFLARMTRGITDRYVGVEADGLKRRSEELAG